MNSLESTFHSAIYPLPLWVRGSLCANPECECGDVFLELLDHADGGRAGDGPPVLELRVDTETWQEVEAPERPAPLENLAREFLREYSAGARAAWQVEVERKRREARRLREYCCDLLLPDATALADQLLRDVESPLGRRVGRNEPCPCGSGKKFKKCCGR